jgi:hypothetical protein
MSLLTDPSFWMSLVWGAVAGAMWARLQFWRAEARKYKELYVRGTPIIQVKKVAP